MGFLLKHFQDPPMGGVKNPKKVAKNGTPTPKHLARPGGSSGW